MRIVAWACGWFVLLNHTWYRFRKLVARTYCRTLLEACGQNPRFDPLSSQIRYQAVRLGDNVYLGPGAVIGRAHIGNDVMFGPSVHVRNGNHSIGVVGMTIREANDPRDDHDPILIGDDVWVGEETTILHKGSIGEGSVIGTRSLVNRPIPPYVVAAGQPCRIIKERFSDDELRRHLTLRGRSQEETERIVAERRYGLEAFGITPDPAGTGEVDAAS